MWLSQVTKPSCTVRRAPFDDGAIACGGRGGQVRRREMIYHRTTAIQLQAVWESSSIYHIPQPSTTINFLMVCVFGVAELEVYALVMGIACPPLFEALQTNNMLLELVTYLCLAGLCVEGWRELLTWLHLPPSTP